ncbi:hypothetical protein [uncultured Clostridium sp.]|mgnify:CR=1 FL=1|uniref:hypothetical protein n=1 Tax=uncultured Clostridium sp. TaxID=59620 RepID=UPI0025D93C41|nr:hypothetical protein [uncultured Clostridium sp.]
MIDWSKFNYIEYVLCFFISLMLIRGSLLIFKTLSNSGNRKEINIFRIIDCLFDIGISSLIAPFILIGMSTIVKNTNTDINNIIWTILIFLLLKRFYINVILILKNFIGRLRKIIF